MHKETGDNIDFAKIVHKRMHFNVKFKEKDKE